jgi:hypothetical protein
MRGGWVINYRPTSVHERFYAQQEVINFRQCLAVLLPHIASEMLMEICCHDVSLSAIWRECCSTHGSLYLDCGGMPTVTIARYPFQIFRVYVVIHSVIIQKTWEEE